MADQPRVEALEESRFFSDGAGARPQVPGTIARGQEYEETPSITGKIEGRTVQKMPVRLSRELIGRGRERFGIFCAHCHGPSGYGDGLVLQRGFPQPPSYHIDRLRNAADGHVFLVISNGFGRMPAFGTRIPPSDRWAIVAYVRTLQLSQYIATADLTDKDRQALPK